MQKSYLIGFVGVILVTVLLAVILNYFNIINFSKILPKQLNFLPKTYQSTTSQQTNQTPFDSCPLDLSPCPEAEVINSTKQVSKATPEGYRGLGFNLLPPGTNVVAIISGQYEVSKVDLGSGSKDSDQGLVNISIQNQDYQVTYLIAGQTSNLGTDTGEVIKDQQIAVLSGGNRGQNYFGKLYNMIISVKDLKSGQYLNINSSEDGLSIE